MTSSMDPVHELVDELERNPSRFRATGGYERLLKLLRDGHAPDALKKVLRTDAEFVGDLLWTVTELESVAPFASEAVEHISSPDRGTAAYAIEVVIRGWCDRNQLRAVFQQLSSCDVAICEHAVRTLAEEGLARLEEIFEAAGWMWAAALAKQLKSTSLEHEVVESLVSDAARNRQIVGLVLATLAAEQDTSFVDCLVRSEEAWIREYGEWLEQMFGGS